MFELIIREAKNHASEEGDALAKKRNRRTAVLAILGGTLFLMVGLALAWLTYEEERQRRLLESEPVEGIATIEDLSLD